MTRSTKVYFFLFVRFSDTEIQPDGAKRIRMAIMSINNTLKLIVPIYSSLLTVANALPNPSDYAKHGVWEEWQEKVTAILFLHPADKRACL
jgi:hypothetical protein